jgi:syntaxin 16
MTKIKKKLKELSNLHDKHLNRPTLDDNFEEERSIDLLTQEITQV